MFMMPGIPFVLYGDELEMKTIRDLPSKDGGYQRTGTRIPMIWNDTKPYHGFSSQKPYLPFNKENRISVDKATRGQSSLYHFICELIRLRSNIKDLSDPHVEIEEDDRVFIFKRGKYQLIMNMSSKPHSYKGKLIISTSPVEGNLPAGTAALIRP